MSNPRVLPGLVGLAMLLFAVPALAGTWQWRDAGGRMVYSDLPPPPEIHASRIVRAPASAPAQAEAAAGSTAGATANPAPAPARAASAPPGWAEREQASRKRALERDEAEARQRDEREQAARAARACEDARVALRTLESGMRVATLNARGEREVLDDGERARRIESLRGEVRRSCAKSG